MGELSVVISGALQTLSLSPVCFLCCNVIQDGFSNCAATVFCHGALFLFDQMANPRRDKPGAPLDRVDLAGGKPLFVCHESLQQHPRIMRLCALSPAEQMGEEVEDRVEEFDDSAPEGCAVIDVVPGTRIVAAGRQVRIRWRVGIRRVDGIVRRVVDEEGTARRNACGE